MGRPALQYLLRQRAQLFAEVPMVHMAVASSVIAAAQPLPGNVVGVPVNYDFGGTIEQALRWHPKARRLVVVTGATPATSGLPRKRVLRSPGWTCAFRSSTWRASRAAP